MRVVLAYAGDLEGSAAIQWLRDAHQADVVTMTVDLGQGAELEAIRDRALTLGARRAHVIDARERFAEHFVMPALRADALHDGVVPMAEALARPLIAQNLAEIAVIERADAVAHTSIAGATPPFGSRMDALLGSLGVAVPVLAPNREWTLTPAALASFARRHGLPATADRRPDITLWGETAVAGQPATAAASNHADRPVPPAETAHLDVSFERGVPTAVNGVAMPLLEMVTSLGTLGTMYEIGFTAAAALECRAPAATMLHLAHRALAQAVADDAQRHFSSEATRVYANLVERAAWFSTLRMALDDYFLATNAGLTGRVRLQLHRGSASVIGLEGLSGPHDASGRSPSREEYS